MIIGGIAWSVRRIRGLRVPASQVLSWKLAILLPLLTTTVVTLAPSLHLGYQYAVGDSTLGDSTMSSLDIEKRLAPIKTTAISATDSTLPHSVPASEFNHHAKRLSPVMDDRSVAPMLPRFNWQTLSLAITGLWSVTVVVCLVRLAIQIKRLRTLRMNSVPIESAEVQRGLMRIAQKMRIRQPVDLLETANVDGALTAGIRRPFILVQAQKVGDANGSRLNSEWDALLAHEFAHIANRDAKWNLFARLVQCLFPFQLLNRFASRQLRIAMDFAADDSASRVLGDQQGLIHCLIRMGDQIIDQQMHRLKQSGLVAGVAAFRSTLGQRVERLLSQNTFSTEVAPATRFKLLTCLTLLALAVTALVPQAVAERKLNTPRYQTLSSQGNTMKSQLSALAVLIGLSAPLVADEPQSQNPVQQLAELKSTPDELPAGIKRFNGMLVGRLAAKDVEKGAFVVVVDAIPRVWKNSQAENPKSIVGKSVEIKGVFGKFLDVLVTTRPGETVEFECKHDGDALVFPGELLRKVAPYKAEDYPVLPEAFRGFRGAVVAEVKKKDPETFELIIAVKKIADVWKGNEAKQPESIVGKEMMLAGFWNRKEAYHKLNVGDQIEIGMQHIGRQSDHLTVAEFVRQSDRAQMENMRQESPVVGRSDNPIQGFRGMIVGRLVKKDVERGTFTVTVDAVPRVWQNNQSRSPKSLLGNNVNAEGVPPGLLDALVVTRIGETIQFGALHDGGENLRVGEVLRKVAPVEAGDYPELPDDFRGFSGILQAKVVKKDEQLWELTAEVTDVVKAFEKDRSRIAKSIIGKQVMLSGFWNKKDAYHGITVGDHIELGVEHPQRLGDQLSVIEGVRKLDK
ncbi:M56 family metallopeptidase [Stieleria sp. ICT_E10.1]|uniref:M56 family metallopeptidase n=1 Tax=Stieleria sedimenti TaxID=2976331 RepID=UPI0021803F4E|nr:M56 family metallopeptidase [Stieleria sedimenti]MCS7465187.1 M56 family metallopeptidase [Stieleria sedimenti]